MHVYLFDIDGTLIRAGGAGVAALKTVLREEFGAGDGADETEVAGRTDRAIAHDMFAAHGVAPTEENWDRFQAGYLRRLPESLRRSDGHVLPGVRELLTELGTRPRTVLGLLTCNTQAGARVKLEHFGLMHHFSMGSYGDHRQDRDDIARDAVELLQRQFDGQVSPERIWVLGDTPRDIRCARAIGARVLAVATGSHTRDELAACQPDVHLDDLAATAHVLSLITA